MFSNRLSILAIFAALGLFLGVAPARAADAGPGKIAVVDVQKILTESKAAKDVQKQLDTQRDSFKQEMAKHEQELRDMEKEIAGDQSKTSAEDMAKKKQEFESKVLDARKLVQKRRQALEQAAAGAILSIRKEIAKVVADIAKKQDYALVLTRQDVVLVKEDLDITGEVMKGVDKNLPKLSLSLGDK